MSGQSRTTVFWTSAALLFVVLSGALGVGIGLAERAGIGHDLGGKVVGAAITPIFFLSVMSAVMVCRALRVSGESSTREVLTQSVPVVYRETLEVRTAPKRWRDLAILYTIPVGVFVATVWTSLPLRPSHWWMLLAGALFVSAFIHCVYKALIPGPPVVRLDNQTIFTGLWRRTVAWDQVRSCEIITYRNVFAMMARITFKLYGDDHRLLMKCAFVPPFQPDEECIFDALRGRFAHSEVIVTPPMLVTERAGS